MPTGGMQGAYGARPHVWVKVIFASERYLAVWPSLQRQILGIEDDF
jgi:hypothetical protein